MSEFVYPNLFDRDVLSAPPIWPLPQLGPHGPILVGAGERQASVAIAYATHVKRPALLPVLAVAAGAVTYASADVIAIDHHNGFVTYYTNLDHVFAKPRSTRARRKPDRVRRGDVVGFLTNPAKPLGFEIWRVVEDAEHGPVGPGAHLRMWERLPWSNAPLNDNTTDAPVAA